MLSAKLMVGEHVEDKEGRDWRYDRTVARAFCVMSVLVASLDAVAIVPWTPMKDSNCIDRGGG
jgi:hypothetical protein